MLIAILSDIHANREAFEAVLAAVREAGADRIVILGDIVGYGADPEWCVQTAMELADKGAVVLRGNHDQAVSDSGIAMNAMARTAIVWTRNQLDDASRNFLASLPMQVAKEDRLYVHSDASHPEKWKYVLTVSDAAAHFAGCEARISFCGHVHVPMLYGTSVTGKVIRFPPAGLMPIPLMMQHRWLAVIGAVGQPRDGNPAAAYALYDESRNELSFRRTAYDIETAANKIRMAGLPEFLADRLMEGR